MSEVEEIFSVREVREYKTTIFNVTSVAGDEFFVTHNESYDDIFVFEWDIKDDDNDDVTHEQTRQSLIDFCSKQL